MSAAVAPPARDRMPAQIRFIVGNEACERFAYYGMLSILTLYLKNRLQMDKAEATEVAHVFKMAVYFLPLFGGWLADRWLGRYRTILYLSLFYCAGPALLAACGQSRTGLYLGLALIALGSGGIKPCVSAFVGDQFRADQQHQLSRAYSLFYWSINLGAFLAFALIPVVRDRAGYGWAFGVPGLFMLAATAVFWLGRKRYVRMPPSVATDHEGVGPVFWYAIGHRRERRPGQRWLDVARARFKPETVDAAQALAGILVIFASIPVFWALFDQINTTWVLQGEKMRTFDVLGYRMDAERIQSISALLVLIWIPVLTVWVYPAVERCGLRPTLLRRIGTGMFLAGSAFALCGWVQARMDAGASLSLAWQIPPYILLEAGEVMVSATGLEFAFSHAPPMLKSTVMSFWLLTVATGNFLVAVFTGLNHHFVNAQGASEFYFYAALMLLVTGVFAVCALRYRPVVPTPAAKP